MSRHLRVTLPDDTEIVLARTFDAPRTLVYAAFTRPELLRRWYGARGWRLVRCDMDLRVGKAWRYESRGPDGERMVQPGVFRVVESPERLVYTEVFDDQSYPGEALITRAFVAEPERTTVTATVRYPSRWIRDHVLRYPMARGVAESYERLDGVLEAAHKVDNSVREERKMNWTLEVVVVPVADVDRAKTFYADQLGFNVDHDTTVIPGTRVVQLTPPGSGCSIVLGEGDAVPQMPPGSLKGLQLVVKDIHAARAQLMERGVAVSEVRVLGENPRPVPDPLDNVGFVFFSDPDGNAWSVQQISSRDGDPTQ